MLPGNNSTPISNSDFSGQNLTESDFTKTIMKQLLDFKR